jgi:hypothetical protein
MLVMASHFERRTRTSFVPQRLHQLRHSPSTRCALERDRRWPTTEQTIRQINARLLKVQRPSAAFMRN